MWNGPSERCRFGAIRAGADTLPRAFRLPEENPFHGVVGKSPPRRWDCSKALIYICLPKDQNGPWIALNELSIRTGFAYEGAVSAAPVMEDARSVPDES